MILYVGTLSLFHIHTSYVGLRPEEERARAALIEEMTRVVQVSALCCVRVCEREREREQAHTYIHTYLHILTHTYLLTHTYTYIHITAALPRGHGGDLWEHDCIAR